MPAAYVIVDIEVKNQEAYMEYVALAPATVTAYGGEYLVRGGNIEVIEGDWSPKRIALLRFDSVEQAKKWLDSPEYTAIKDVRIKNQYPCQLSGERVIETRTNAAEARESLPNA
jgi:uncharacterized protein (DUF1330 family)